MRAYNVACFGGKKVLELCCGPSLPLLEAAYGYQNIEVTGNDIDPGYAERYPAGKWSIGDCLTDSWTLYLPFDTIVFKPPTKGGTISIDDINPSYEKFIDAINLKDKLGVCVFAPNILDTRESRKQMYKFLSFCQDKYWLKDYEFLPSKAGSRKPIKYWELYLDFRPKPRF